MILRTYETAISIGIASSAIINDPILYKKKVELYPKASKFSLKAPGSADSSSGKKVL